MRVESCDSSNIIRVIYLAPDRSQRQTIGIDMLYSSKYQLPFVLYLGGTSSVLEFFGLANLGRLLLWSGEDLDVTWAMSVVC